MEAVYKDNRDSKADSVLMAWMVAVKAVVKDKMGH